MPACTVVIPCFNHATALAECLASLGRQSFEDWEAFVVDDASTEGDVRAVVEQFADRRVTYVRHEENRGLAAARNTGIRLGTGDLILPLDSDDRLDARFLEVLVPVLRNDPKADCVFPDFALFGVVSRTLPYRVRDTRALLTSQWLPGAGCLYRRSLWEQAGGYCEDPALRSGNEDWEFYIAAAEQGFEARHVPEPLYQYRISSASMLTRMQYVSHVSREFIYARHRGLFDRLGGGATFLAEGYLGSARASYSRAERGRAIRFVLRSLRLQPTNRRAIGILARCLTPPPVLAVARRLRAATTRDRTALTD